MNAVVAGRGPLTRVERALWKSLLLLIPISSSPILPLDAGTQIRPLAVIPMALLLGLAGIRVTFLGQRPTLRNDKGCFAFLLLFGLYALLSGLVSVNFLADVLFKGQTPLGGFVRALITLAIGIGFYTVSRLHICNAADAKLTERYLFIGMGASIEIG